MAELNLTGESWKERLDALFQVREELSILPLDQRINDYIALQTRRRELVQEQETVKSRIFVHETFGDMQEYLVRNDPLAMDIMGYIKTEGGSIPYKKLCSELTTEGRDMDNVGSYLIHILSNAVGYQFIAMDNAGTPEETIRLTEKGMKLVGQSVSQ